jgi:hypothetical protein
MARVLLLTAALLGSHASSAGAECAWVLWFNRETVGEKPSTPRRWTPEKAFTTAAECEASKSSKMNEVIEVLKGLENSVTPTTDGDRFYSSSPASKETNAWTYKCLPDTVEPPR